jgi:hypothetical protein
LSALHKQPVESTVHCTINRSLGHSILKLKNLMAAFEAQKMHTRYSKAWKIEAKHNDGDEEELFKLWIGSIQTRDPNRRMLQ